MKPMPPIIDITEDFVPLCPHCDEPLTKIIRLTSGFLQRAALLACPHCRRVIGGSSDWG
jgi:hypothetical protein